MVNITLVQPNVDEGLEYISRNGIFPPLGLCSIATYLDKKMKTINKISVFDLSINGALNFESMLNESDFVGISVNSFNYQNSLKIAKYAKEKGAKVILGGVHARALKKLILRKRECVDFIIDGEGEEAFCALVEGRDIKKTPNLVYRNRDGKIIQNRKEELNLSCIPITDRKFLNMDKYFKNFEKYNTCRFPFKHPASIYSHKGCTWRDISGGCIFCARDDTHFKTVDPIKFWEEVQYLRDNYNIDYIWNISDDILGDVIWLKRVLEERPAGIGVKFLNYARADHITEESITLLTGLNTYELVVGFETGDSKLLKNSYKGYRMNSNQKAVNLLSKTDIFVYPMFVVGLPEEDTKTFENTLEFIRKLILNCKVVRFVITFLIPFPGSKAFDMLKEKYPSKYCTNDFFHTDEAVNDWFMTFTSIKDLRYIKDKFKAFSDLGFKENEDCHCKYSFEFTRLSDY